MPKKYSTPTSGSFRLLDYLRSMFCQSVGWLQPHSGKINWKETKWKDPNNGPKMSQKDIEKGLNELISKCKENNKVPSVYEKEVEALDSYFKNGKNREQVDTLKKEISFRNIHENIYQVTTMFEELSNDDQLELRSRLANEPHLKTAFRTIFSDVSRLRRPSGERRNSAAVTSDPVTQTDLCFNVPTISSDNSEMKTNNISASQPAVYRNIPVHPDSSASSAISTKDICNRSENHEFQICSHSLDTENNIGSLSSQHPETNDSDISTNMSPSLSPEMNSPLCRKRRASPCPTAVGPSPVCPDPNIPNPVKRRKTGPLHNVRSQSPSPEADFTSFNTDLGPKLEDPSSVPTFSDDDQDYTHRKIDDLSEIPDEESIDLAVFDGLLEYPEVTAYQENNDSDYITSENNISDLSVNVSNPSQLESDSGWLHSICGDPEFNYFSASTNTSLEENRTQTINMSDLQTVGDEDDTAASILNNFVL